jgi:hypothetical protein
MTLLLRAPLWQSLESVQWPLNVPAVAQMLCRRHVLAGCGTSVMAWIGHSRAHLTHCVILSWWALQGIGCGYSKWWTCP